MLVPTVHTGRFHQGNGINCIKANYEYTQVWKDRLEGLGISQKPIPFTIQNLQWRGKAAGILFRVGMAKRRNDEPSAIEWLQCCHDFVSAQNQDQEVDQSFKSLRQAVLYELST